MFNELVPEYDRFNRLSSLGLDAAWRRELVRFIKGRKYILDVGTGTGDVAFELARQGAKVLGIDFSERMVTAARRKVGSNTMVSFQVGRADLIPQSPSTFDGITSAFVLRNLNEAGTLGSSLREFHRVLKPGGQMVHLELTRPLNKILNIGHRMYINMFLPMVGKACFGSRWPSNYLNKTITQFPDPNEICQRIRWAGFDQVSHYPLSGGIASLFSSVKC